VITFNSDVPSKEIVRSEETGEKPIDDLTDLGLAKQCLALIPSDKWSFVVKELTTDIVTLMPQHMMDQVTGDKGSQDMTEAILYQYYLVIAEKEEVLTDAFRILGKYKTLNILDSLELTTT
jgi:hypothetical protein